MTRKLLRLAAWAVLIGLILATLSPISARPQSGLPVNLERTIAFVVAGGLLAMAYPARIWLIGCLLVGFIFSLELMQHLTPDRHGHTVDAIFKAVGAIVGIAAGALITTVPKLLAGSRKA